jgi:ribonuclease HI
MIPPFAAVGRAHQAWTDIGASPWLVRQLRFGLQLPWNRKPRTTRAREYNLSLEDLLFARCEVGRWVSAGYCREANGADMRALRRVGSISPAFVTTSAMKSRLVIDYSLVNECLDDRSFRMEQLADLSPSLRPDDCLFKADIKDAYYHLRLRDADQLLLAFRVGGRTYIPACLNCGLSVAPWFFTKAMRPVVAHLRSRGHRIYSYLDDFFGAAATACAGAPATEVDTQQAGRDISALFRRLGLWLHPTKCDFSGRRELEILGILVDTRRAMFLLSPTKLRKLETAARRLLAYASSHRRHVPARALRSFAGLGNSTNLAVVDARLRLRELFDALSQASSVPMERSTPAKEPSKELTGERPGARTKSQSAIGRERDGQPRREPENFRAAPLGGRSHHFLAPGAAHSAACPKQPRLSHAAMRDLQWWARLSDNPHVGREVWPAPTASIFTDASMRGWGAVWNGQVPACGFFDAAQEGSSINELELLAAIHGVREFAGFARGQQLLLVSDSQVTVHIVRNWTSRSPRLLAHLRTLRELCETRGITLSTRHLPSVLNIWADRLSRRRDSTAWGLPPTSTLLLARRLRAQILDGEGLPPPGAGARGSPPLVLPRPALLPVWHRHLQRLGRGFLIGPAWKAQAWYQDAARYARVTPLPDPATPPWASVLVSYGPQPRPPPLPGPPLA